MSESYVDNRTDNSADGWRRWRMGELDTAGRRRQEQARASSQAAFQRRTELEALREQVREEARQEGYQAGLEAGRQEGYRDGLEQGRQDGEQESARQRHATLAPLAGLAERFREALTQLDHDIAEQLVDLAMATGRQLAGEALQARPEQILAIVRELLHDEPALNGQTRLWLHPEDLALVEADLGQELSAAGWRLQPDEQLHRGGCRVTSPTGELDASWDSRWNNLQKRVRRKARRDEGARP